MQNYNVIYLDNNFRYKFIWFLVDLNKIQPFKMFISFGYKVSKNKFITYLILCISHNNNNCTRTRKQFTGYDNII